MGQKPRGQPALATVTCGGGQSWGTQPLAWGTRRPLRVGRVRTEFPLENPSWCGSATGCCGKPPTPNTRWKCLRKSSHCHKTKLERKDRLLSKVGDSGLRSRTDHLQDAPVGSTHHFWCLGAVPGAKSTRRVQCGSQDPSSWARKVRYCNQYSHEDPVQRRDGGWGPLRQDRTRRGGWTPDMESHGCPPVGGERKLPKTKGHRGPCLIRICLGLVK